MKRIFNEMLYNLKGFSIFLLEFSLVFLLVASLITILAYFGAFSISC